MNNVKTESIQNDIAGSVVITIHKIPAKIYVILTNLEITLADFCRIDLNLGTSLEEL